MFLKTQIEKAKVLAHWLLLNPNVRRIVESVPGLQNALPVDHRLHPIDTFYGIETRGFVPVSLIHRDPEIQDLIIPYLGSQPSVTRAALASLPIVNTHSFVDLGCGKGRAVIVASEFPFKQITGIELSPDLAKIAQANVAKITQKFPGRPPMKIIAGNILDDLPLEGRMVFYFYNPMGSDLTAQLASKIEAALSAKLEHVFFIYHNPVWGAFFDRSAAFKRWGAETIPFDASEIKAAGDREDHFIIWQSHRNAYPGARPGADRKIVFLHELRAELGPIA